MDSGLVVADTDTFLDFIEGEGTHYHVAELLRNGRLATTAVTIFELWRGLEFDVEREFVRRAIRGVRVYPLSEVAAKCAAELHRGLNETPIGDLLIAAVCLTVHRPLLTSNVEHFKRVPGLDVVQARYGGVRRQGATG